MYPHGQGYPGYPPQQPQYMNVGFSNFAPQSFGQPNPNVGFSNIAQQQTGYPPQGYQGYPPRSNVTPDHSSSLPSGYPGQIQSGYPAAPGYPSSTHYPAQQSHSASYHAPQGNPGYPSHPPATGYPSHPATGYPSQSPATGYPPHPPTTGNPNPSPYPNSGGYPAAGYPAHAQSSPQLGTSKPSRPTVVPVQPFNPRADAEALRTAMKGFGTDDKAIIKILTKRSNEQRLKIAFEFKTLYGKDLVKDLKSETSGNFEDLLVALMTPLPQYYAKELHDAMAGIGTDEDVLIEVMCSLSNHEIDVIKQCYTAMYGEMLEDDLRGDTSGCFKRLMTSLCTGNRSEDFVVNQEKAREDARLLLQAGELRMGTDESQFNAILCSRSIPQLNAIFNEYKFLTGHDIDEAIKREFSGDDEKALLAIVKLVRSKPSFFAERLYKSMKGMGTNDRQLIRVMVTRCEVDLADISDAYQSKYGKTLQSDIEGDCSGSYKKCLLGLLGAY